MHEAGGDHGVVAAFTEVLEGADSVLLDVFPIVGAGVLVGVREAADANGEEGVGEDLRGARRRDEGAVGAAQTVCGAVQGEALAWKELWGV